MHASSTTLKTLAPFAGHFLPLHPATDDSSAVAAQRPAPPLPARPPNGGGCGTRPSAVRRQSGQSGGAEDLSGSKKRGLACGWHDAFDVFSGNLYASKLHMLKDLTSKDSSPDHLVHRKESLHAISCPLAT